MSRPTFARAFLRYTILFLIVLAIILAPMLIKGKVFVHNSDGVSQHVPFMQFYARWLRDTASAIIHGQPVAMYSHTMGYGSDILYALNWYGMGDPLNLLYVCFGPSRILLGYTVIHILRVYLAGLAMLLLIRRFGKLDRYSPFAGCAYAFGAFAFSVGLLQHPIFINPMIQLPMLIVGIDRVLKRESGVPFILSVAWTALCGYYFLYMCSVFLFLFALIWHFDVNRSHAWRTLPALFGKSVIYYLVGLCLAGPVFFPSCLGFLHGGRAGEVMALPALSINWAQRLFALPLSIMAPLTKGTNQPAMLWLGGLLTLLSLKKHRFGVRTLCLCAFVMLACPLTDYLMNGFAYPTSRWTFGPGILIVALGIAGLSKLAAMTRRQRIAVDAFSWIMIVYFTARVAMIFVKNHFALTRDTLEGAAYPGFVAAGFFVSWAAIRWVNSRRFQAREHAQARGRQALACVMLASVIATCYLWEVPRMMTNTYQTPSRIMEGIYGASPLNDPALQGAEGFVRVDCDVSAQTHRNDTVTSNVSCTQFYNSTLAESLYNGVNEMALPMFICNNLCGLNSRAPLEALWSVSHYVRSVEGGNMAPVPYGFERIEANERYEVYKNTLALPFGYTTDAYVLDEEYAAASAVEKQWTLLQGATLAREDASLRHIEPEYAFTRPELSMDCGEGVEWLNGTLTAREGGQMTLRFEGPENCEAYLEIGDLRYEKYDSNTIVWNIRGEALDYNVAFSTPDHHQFSRQSNLLIQLGCGAQARREVTVTFRQGFKARLGELSVVCQPMAGLKARLDALRSHAMTRVALDVNQIRGEVQVDKDSVLILPLPYSAGWIASVDEKRADTFPSGTAFTALKLPAGEHRVTLRYHTPGFCAGVIALAISLIAIAAIALLERRRKKENPEK